MLETLASHPGLEEAAVVAIELARLGLLDAENMFPTYSGAPFRGSDTDRRNTLLISRVACLGKLEHNTIGFTGPLSKHLLGYQSMINTVRGSLRDLMEVTITQFFLSGGAERDRSDFTDLGLELPFLLSNDCGLGIAVKSYLDELVGASDRSSAEVKESVKERGATEWFPHSVEFAKNIDKAFVLWDAVCSPKFSFGPAIVVAILTSNQVYKGIKTAGRLVENARLFDEVNEWLEPLR
ncbi:hypothetical protein P152DRAFT_185644 [Eremomyces bilateralis CBS 781.70]|uniref:Post-transcriptional regulator MKT1 C-terminal domain-containing protein n=1 Tax=Eremomyces bilateralis CBS 781.70 TaxID=1392243 RepID=A0A6G1GC17_9PEZI|nr:uncharacterized protein P152DRAFT_185644 [Eremomyces bilateralis CBS 781.70]KAF1815441.1 hypothetical protein P152DRAFT_185644 [Eremomyces bilateralis CBS 781.70]